MRKWLLASVAKDVNHGSVSARRLSSRAAATSPFAVELVV
jgi:hypothetical protein